MQPHSKKHKKKKTVTKTRHLNFAKRETPKKKRRNPGKTPSKTFQNRVDCPSGGCCRKAVKKTGDTQKKLQKNGARAKHPIPTRKQNKTVKKQSAKTKKTADKKVLEDLKLQIDCM